MKPKGHKEIASFYSTDVIKEASKRLPTPPVGKVNVQAMLLANWITDVSQFVIFLYGVNEKVGSNIRGLIDVPFEQLYAILLDDGTGQLMLDVAAKQLRLLGEGDATLKEIMDEWHAYLGEQIGRVTDGIEDKLEELGCNAGDRSRGSDLRDVDSALDFVDDVRQQACRELLGWTGDVAEMPDALRERLREVEKDLQPLFSHLTSLAEQIEAIDLDDIQSRLETARMELHASIDTLFPDDYRRQGELHELVQSVILLLGYFQFVHPERPGEKRDFPYHIFKGIVDHYYTAGWTYKHMDRALDPAGPSPYRSEKPSAEESPYGLYDYLEEDIAILVSQLYEIERDWAIPYFERGERQISDGDDHWHAGLAQLGATLHAVQDFFAHTTFMEHAFRGDWDRRTRHLSQSEKSHIFKRLHGWEHRPRARKRKSWREFSEETHIVSGYFDCMDTAVALLRMLFDFLGENIGALETLDLERSVSDTAKDVDELISDPVGELKKKLGEVAEIIVDGRKAVEDVTNETAQKHKKMLEEYGIAKELHPPQKVDPRLVRDLLADSHLFYDAPPEILNWAIHAMQLMLYFISGGKRLYRTLKLAKDIVDLIKFVEKLRRRPRQVLRDVPGWLAEKFAEYARKVGLHLAQEGFLHTIGADRLGSHSLIAKDDEHALLYEEAMNLAMFVDAYIVSLLVRAPYDPADHRFQSPRQVRLTRWEDVLGHFLNHPYGSFAVKQNPKVELVDDFWISIDARRSPNSLYTTARHFKGNAKIPAEYKRRPQQPYGYTSYDWKVIADANFPTYGLTTEQTKRVINEILSTPAARHPMAGKGFTVKDGINQAFKTGTQVRVPFQKIEFTTVTVDFLERVWWLEVFELGDRRQMLKLFQAWTADGSKVPFDIPFRPGHHIYNVDDPNEAQALDELLATRFQQGEALRVRREEEERAARMKGSILECIFDSLGDRAIY